MDLAPGYFDALFRGNDDPWAFKSRWYESRKRAITLAVLPHPRYASAYEPGCANGELSAALATRCERLLVSDGNERAVTLARARLAGCANTRVVRAAMPTEWPDETFDLVVLSEIGYFLSAADLDTVTARVRAGLNPGGTVVACHWRRPIDGCDMGGDVVNERIGRGLALPHLSGVLEADFRLDVWTEVARSVAQREGLS